MRLLSSSACYGVPWWTKGAASLAGLDATYEKLKRAVLSFSDYLLSACSSRQASWKRPGIVACQEAREEWTAVLRHP